MCLLLVLPLAFASCEKEVLLYEEMVVYHRESLGLSSVPVDSVTRFSTKVDRFVHQHPGAEYDPLYPEILQNIHAASIRFTFYANTEWEADTIIYYKQKK